MLQSTFFSFDPTVYLILVSSESLMKDCIVFESHGGNLQTLKSNSPLYDPMSYTLLFPYGDLGWTYNMSP